MPRSPPLGPEGHMASGTHNDLALLKLSHQLTARHLLTARLVINWLGSPTRGSAAYFHQGTGL